ncbi:MAG: hypothetical protein JST58_12150 [Bacteroidetes bacterium]|nr:hypothetical protein [Bacteroidota bacterium]
MKRTAVFSFKKKLAFSVMACLLFFLFIELVARTVFLFKYHKDHTSVYIQGGPLQIGDSSIVFRNTPYYIDYDHRFQNSELGFRSAVGDWRQPTKTDHDFWVLLTGASAMEGMGSNKDGNWVDITGVQDYVYEKTIAHKLQVILQKELPNRRVRVFNGANSGYILWQSYQRYENLKKELKPDWVVSLDGNNEYASLDDDADLKKLKQSGWEDYPIFKAPSKYIIPFTQRIYSLNSLKQLIYHIKSQVRLQKNIKENYPVRAQWLHRGSKPISFCQVTHKIQNAIDAYMYWLHQYDSSLSRDGVNHLLIYQPFLFDKNFSTMGDTEKALYNYYSWNYNDSVGQTFKTIVKKKLEAEESTNPNLLVLDANRISGQTFVDYCHFTEIAADSITAIIGSRILASIKK